MIKFKFWQIHFYHHEFGIFSKHKILGWDGDDINILKLTLYDEMFQCCKYLCTKLLQSCPTLCDPMDRSPPGFSITNSQSFSDSCLLSWWCHPTISSSFVPFSSCLILHKTVLEWVAMPASRGSSQSRDRTHVSYISCIDRWVLHH